MTSPVATQATCTQTAEGGLRRADGSAKISAPRGKYVMKASYSGLTLVNI